MKCSCAPMEAAGFKGVRHAPCRWGRHTFVCLAGRAEVSPMALNGTYPV